MSGGLVTGAFCGGRWRGCWTVRMVSVMCALAAALLAAPAAASACASYANVKSFHGFGSARFVNTASGDDGNGGIASVTLDEGAAGLQFPSVTPQPGTRRHAWIGKAEGGGKGGVVGVDDAYSDSSGGQATTGGQTARGPTDGGGVAIGFSPSGKCAYQLRFSFGIVTTPSGQWPAPYSQGGPGPDHGVTGYAASPLRSIPAGLKLSGTATVGAYCGGVVTDNGSYNFQGLYPGNDSWGGEFCSLSGAGSGQPVGSATITWHFLPTLATKHSHKK